MSRIRSRDTKPEVAVRSLLHRHGFRFRKHVRSLPGNPDIVLPKYQTVIFVHGCFWHRHRGCKRCTTPKDNAEYWVPKLLRNVERDARQQEQLRRQGWKVAIVWECEVRDETKLARRFLSLLKKESAGAENWEP